MYNLYIIYIFIYISEREEKGGNYYIELTCVVMENKKSQDLQVSKLQAQDS